MASPSTKTATGKSSRRPNIGFDKAGALEEQRLLRQRCERVGETVAEVEAGRVACSAFRQPRRRRNFTSRACLSAAIALLLRVAQDETLMNALLFAVGSILMALGLVMAANRSGYVYFVVGPRSVLVLAGAIAVAALAFRILHAPE
jgi:hypothetical protein